MRRIVSTKLIIHHRRITAGVFARRSATDPRFAGCNAVEQEFEPAAVGRVAVLCDRNGWRQENTVEQELDPTVPDLFRISS